MKIATVGLDLAKTCSRFMEWIRRDISSYANICVALMCCRFSRSLSRAW
jgi:hypothetical protein